jgi:hypothetical protein
VADNTTSLIVVQVSRGETMDSGDVESAMKSVVQGNIVSFEELSTDWAAVKKVSAMD